MPTDENRVVFKSTIQYNAERIHAAAVYCSDGRFGEQCDELMHVALGLPRYDRLAVPGGAACLAGHFATYREEEGVGEQLRFLVRTHGLERVVLIAHEHCGFYTGRLQISPLQLESQQREDIRKAVWRVRAIGRDLMIDAFLARKRWDGSIQFETIDV
jgi:Putative carbonic anhydrase